MALSSPSRRDPDYPTIRGVCTILGGPNGSGKSSVFASLGLPGRFINADEVARGIDPTSPERVSFAAGKRVLGELDRQVTARESFVYETTLSSRQSVELMRRALDADYEVGLVFVGLRDADLNVQRVAQRVAEGGHNIPEDVIRRRYDTSLKRLGEAIGLAHGTMIFDNSAASGPVLVIQIDHGVVAINNLDATVPFHARIASIVDDALSVTTNAAAKTIDGEIRSELSRMEDWQLDFATRAANVPDRDGAYARPMGVPDAARVISPDYAAIEDKADGLRQEATRLAKSIEHYAKIRDHHHTKGDERWRSMGMLRQYSHKIAVRSDDAMIDHEQGERFADQQLAPLEKRRDELAKELPAAEEAAAGALEKARPAAERKLAELLERAELAREVLAERAQERVGREGFAEWQADIADDKDQDIER